MSFDYTKSFREGYTTGLQEQKMKSDIQEARNTLLQQALIKQGYMPTLAEQKPQSFFQRLTGQRPQYVQQPGTQLIGGLQFKQPIAGATGLTPAQQAELDLFERKEKLKNSIKSNADLPFANVLSKYNPRTTSLEEVSKIKQQFPMKTKEVEDYFDVASMKRPEIAGEEFGLSSQEISEVNTLADSIYGNKIKSKDGYNNFVRPLLARRAKGETIDEIGDDLRHKMQSPEFQGAIRDALQQIVPFNISDKRFNEIEDRLGDLSQKGDIGKVKDFLKQQARNAGTTTEKVGIRAQERTIEFLSEIEQDLKDFEASGGNTNIFSGTAEQMANKIGLTTNPKIKKIATKIQAAIQKYRLGVSGKAFNILESKEYNEIFPDIKSVSNLNSASIAALIEVFQGDVDFYYSSMMGEDAYNKLYKAKEPTVPTQQQIQEGSTIINPNTGEKMILKGGTWQKI
ncbi:MAG: hypothetical protein ACFFG0_03385 [Candidatus Thorarchaeota archaeon]